MGLLRSVYRGLVKYFVRSGTNAPPDFAQNNAWRFFVKDDSDRYWLMERLMPVREYRKVKGVRNDGNEK